MKVTVYAIALWVVGMTIAHTVFLGLSAKVGYGLIFSWWFVTYFTKFLKTIMIVDIIQSFFVSLMLLALVNILGWYDYLYHDAPRLFSIAFTVIVISHSVIFISPLIFNKAVLLLINNLKRHSP